MRRLHRQGSSESASVARQARSGVQGMRCAEAPALKLCTVRQGTEREGAHDEVEDGDGDAKTAAQQLGLEHGPLATVDCSVCMCRPVQVQKTLGKLFPP